MVSHSPCWYAATAMKRRNQSEREKQTVKSNTTLTQEESMLSPHRAFVVQFRMGAEPERFMGRVEHITSGQAARFQSLEELLGFIRRVLREMRE